MKKNFLMFCFLSYLWLEFANIFQKQILFGSCFYKNYFASLKIFKTSFFLLTLLCVFDHFSLILKPILFHTSTRKFWKRFKNQIFFNFQTARVKFYIVDNCDVTALCMTKNELTYSDNNKEVFLLFQLIFL